MRRATLVLLALAASCYRAVEPAAPPPIASCDAAASSMADYLRRTAAHLDAEAVDNLRAVIANRCVKDAWSVEARSCTAGAMTKEQHLACDAKMTHDQQSRLQRATRPLFFDDELVGAVAVSSLEPARGDAAGGTYVVLGGRGFLEKGGRAATVWIGGKEATIVRFADDKQLIVQAPPGRAGETVDVIVELKPGGMFVLPKSFTYVARP